MSTTTKFFVDMTPAERAAVRAERAAIEASRVAKARAHAAANPISDGERQRLLRIVAWS